jgi:hypothetical protein
MARTQIGLQKPSISRQSRGAGLISPAYVPCSYTIGMTALRKKAPKERVQGTKTVASRMVRIPSETMDVYWLFAERQKGQYPIHSDRGGKWLIFAPQTDVDLLWKKIKRATEKGQLGGSAKVATALPNPNVTNPATRVICVFTYDWTDEKDVKRVREELRKLGITSKIPYKADEETHSGKYAVGGHKRISKYYE